MTSIRTLFVSHDGGLAGAQRVLLSTLRGLSHDQVEAHLVVPFDGELQALALASGVSVSRRALRPWAPCIAQLNGGGRLRALQSFGSGFRARVWGLAGLIERLDIDVVYTNTAIIAEGAFAANRTGRPHVWHVHEPIFNNPELLPLLPNWVYSIGISRLATAVIMPSHTLSRHYPSLRAKTSVIYNGIDAPPSVNRSDARQHLRAHLGLADTALLVGTVGAIQPRKDYTTLIAAAAQVHAALPDVRFVVVGQGSDAQVQRFEAEVDAAGLRGVVIRVSRWSGEIFDFFAGVDIAVVSSIQESFGLTVAEALAVGTPVVSTRCGGPEEVLGPDEPRCLVNIGDSVGLAKAIAILCGDAELRNELGTKGRKRVLEKFSQKEFLRGVFDVMRVAGESRRRRLTGTAVTT